MGLGFSREALPNTLRLLDGCVGRWSRIYLLRTMNSRGAAHAITLHLIVTASEADDFNDDVGVVHLDVQLDKIY
jgi:hypothetical protein